MNFKRMRSSKSALGLGGYSYDSVRPGAILEITADFSITFGNFKMVEPRHQSMRMNKNQYLLICDIEPHNKTKRNFLYLKSHDLHVMEMLKEEYKGNYLNLWKTRRGSGTIKNVSKNRFNRKLKVLQP